MRSDTFCVQMSWIFVLFSGVFETASEVARHMISTSAVHFAVSATLNFIFALKTIFGKLASKQESVWERQERTHCHRSITFAYSLLRVAVTALSCSIAAMSSIYRYLTEA